MWAEDERVEILDAGPTEESWTAQVWESSKKQCSNCGGHDRLRAVMIVPEEAGGRRVSSNGALLCRTCDVARGVLERSGEPASGKDTRPINFWISRKLYATVQNGLSHRYGFKSVAALVRFLMGKYVADAARFDDVLQYQDHGTDVKVNVWVPRDVYAQFKEISDRNGGTVTDTIKGLIRMYEMEAERVFEKGRSNEH
jgi:hypothetical protein